MKQWKILLVDDEKEFVSTLAERLRLRGIQAVEANSGEEALLLVETEQPHVVVLDVKMPGMGGLETLRRLKSSHPQIQVILLTGIGAETDGTEGLSLGAYDVLMKPLQIDELIKKLGAAIDAAAAKKA